MSDYFGSAPGRSDTGHAYKWLLWIVGFIVVLGLLGFLVRWLFVPLNTVGPENIQRLSMDANNRYSSLESQLATYEAQQRRLNEYKTLYGEDMAVWPQGKREEYQQLSTQVTNLATAYNGSCGQYEAMWNDDWRNLPAPDDLPKTCERIR